MENKNPKCNGWVHFHLTPPVGAFWDMLGAPAMHTPTLLVHLTNFWMDKITHVHPKEGFYWKIFLKKLMGQDSNPRFWCYYDNALTN